MTAAPMRLLTVLLGLFTLGLGGCDYVAAILLTGATEQLCDPTQHVNRCLDDRTMLNCTRARRGLGGVGSSWAVLEAECVGGNHCEVMDGWAECVAPPTTKCDLRGASERCRDGILERCDRLSFYRGDEHWDGELAAWVSVHLACTAPAPALTAESADP